MFLFYGDIGSVWGDDKVLEMNGADGYTTVNVLNATQLYVYLEILKMVNFIFYISYHNKQFLM